MKTEAQTTESLLPIPEVSGKSKIVSNSRRNKEKSNLMSMSASVMPGHNVTVQKEEMKVEVKNQQDPKEVEASATITRRTSAGGKTNLMKRPGNLMAGTSALSSSTGRGTETVPTTEPISKPVAENKGLSNSLL
jgi:hypothetical protein